MSRDAESHRAAEQAAARDARASLNAARERIRELEAALRQIDGLASACIEGKRLLGPFAVRDITRGALHG